MQKQNSEFPKYFACLEKNSKRKNFKKAPKSAPTLVKMVTVITSVHLIEDVSHAFLKRKMTVGSSRSSLGQKRFSQGNAWCQADPCTPTNTSRRTVVKMDASVQSSDMVMELGEGCELLFDSLNLNIPTPHLLAALCEF